MVNTQLFDSTNQLTRELRAIRREVSGETAYLQRHEAWQILTHITATTDPTKAAWAIGVHYSQHATLVLGILNGGPAVWVSSGGCTWPHNERHPGCAVAATHTEQRTHFWPTTDHKGSPLLTIRNKTVDALLRTARLPEELLTELQAASPQAGLGFTEQERVASSVRAYTAGAHAWELAKPAPSLLDLAAGD